MLESRERDDGQRRAGGTYDDIFDSRREGDDLPDRTISSPTHEMMGKMSLCQVKRRYLPCHRPIQLLPDGKGKLGRKGRTADATGRPPGWPKRRRYQTHNLSEIVAHWERGRMRGGNWRLKIVARSGLPDRCGESRCRQPHPSRPGPERSRDAPPWRRVSPEGGSAKAKKTGGK